VFYPCCSLVDTVGAQARCLPVLLVGWHCWSASEVFTCAARWLTLLERKRGVYLCCSLVDTVGAQARRLPVLLDG
jgi:hypothetical protein